MENLFVQSTDSSPEIQFKIESNVFTIVGESCMSDANVFYAPVLDWLRSYSNEVNSSMMFNFHFSAISQSSMKMLLFVCQEIKSMQIDGNQIDISWCYSKDSEELKEIGQDISYMTELDFSYQEVEEMEMA